jgi:hypothetical protein
MLLLKKKLKAIKITIMSMIMNCVPNLNLDLNHAFAQEEVKGD